MELASSAARRREMLLPNLSNLAVSTGGSGPDNLVDDFVTWLAPEPEFGETVEEDGDKDAVRMDTNQKYWTTRKSTDAFLERLKTAIATFYNDYKAEIDECVDNATKITKTQYRPIALKQNEIRVWFDKVFHSLVWLRHNLPTPNQEELQERNRHYASVDLKRCYYYETYYEAIRAVQPDTPLQNKLPPLVLNHTPSWFKCQKEQPRYAPAPGS